jgi:hypothetical protein
MHPNLNNGGSIILKASSYTGEDKEISEVHYSFAE